MLPLNSLRNKGPYCLLNSFSWFGCFFLYTLLIGCMDSGRLAPVSELSWKSVGYSIPKSHVVRSGETLYAIAFRYDTDYRHLALYNHLRPPYALRVGQILNVRGSNRATPVRRVQAVRPRLNSPLKQPLARFTRPAPNRYAGSAWTWPVRGRLMTNFMPQQGKKGINIACNRGEKIVASSSGRVAYAGSGLPGYGNLIIIKHSNNYLTAYGNSARNLVSEGQYVKQGQAIAEVGVLDHKYWGVHFEIRRTGQPVNPLYYLARG